MSKKICSSAVQPEEMALSREWLSCFINAKSVADTPAASRHSSTVPFSFQCGKKSSREWLAIEDALHKSPKRQDGKRCHFLIWRNPATNLVCEMELTEYTDFPVLEWVVRLRNDGHKASSTISNFHALDISWAGQNGETPELRRSLGSDGRADDFQYVCDDMRQDMWVPQRKIRMDTSNNNALRKVRDGHLPSDGRPSATWLPFFNLRTGSDGIITALGWNGQWFAEFAHDGKGKTDISAGMEHLSLQLQPGESIRSPKVMLLYWQGEPLHAHNMLRQFILKFHTPVFEGKPLNMPVCNGSWGGMPSQGHLDNIKKIESLRLPYEYYWIDAGWYGTSTKPCPDVFHGEWGIVGDWQVNKNYHPKGLKPISEAVHKAGMKLLLWFEPERARYGTPNTLAHPDWYLRKTDEEPKAGEDILLNLGNPEAWRWLVETISAIITDNGIDCYREDFNFDPSPYWKHADTPGRKGLAEIRFVEGLYSFWDELRRRHPKLIIDNCASGGRRIELETIDRSIALWRTDYNCFPHMNPDAAQAHTIGLANWLPSNAISPFAKNGDTYQVRSSFSAGLVFNIDEFGINLAQRTEDQWIWFRKMINEAKLVRPYYYGDFYPLTPCITNSATWLAYQLQLPKNDEGVVLAFRRSDSCMTSTSFQLYDLCQDAAYEFEDADTGEKWLAQGALLTKTGLSISIDTPRSSRLIFYRVIRNKQYPGKLKNG